VSVEKYPMRKLTPSVTVSNIEPLGIDLIVISDFSSKEFVSESASGLKIKA
jgi:hypothetical protein